MGSSTSEKIKKHSCMFLGNVATEKAMCSDVYEKHFRLYLFYRAKEKFLPSDQHADLLSTPHVKMKRPYWFIVFSREYQISKVPRLIWRVWPVARLATIQERRVCELIFFHPCQLLPEIDQCSSEFWGFALSNFVNKLREWPYWVKFANPLGLRWPW